MSAILRVVWNFSRLYLMEMRRKMTLIASGKAKWSYGARSDPAFECYVLLLLGIVIDLVEG